MNRMFGLLAGILVGLIVLIALVGVIGAVLPRTHTVASIAFYHQPVDSVWAAVTDIKKTPAWRSDIKSVERSPDRNGDRVWKLIGTDGSGSLEIIESNPNSSYRIRVADDAQTVGGTWVFYFKVEDGGTRLTLHDDGYISNPFHRFLATRVWGLNAPLDSYLKALGRKFGEAVKPAHTG